MVTVKVHGLFGDESEAEYTEAEYAKLQARRAQQEKEERHVYDVWDAGLREYERRQEETAQRPDLDAIDAALSPHLRKELERENAETRVTAKAKSDFKAFQKCCERWGFPALPAPPQAVAVFLAEESERGASHVIRLRNSISTIHRATNFADPCDDILIKAMVRLIRNEEKGNRPNGK
jgi:hypothetical protein